MGSKAITVGIDAPDAYAAVILGLFGILSPDYFIDPAFMSRVQREINSLRLMAKLGIRSVPADPRLLRRRPRL